MRRFLASVLLATSLSGCGSTGLFSGSNPVITPAEIAQAQAAVKAVCNVIPTADTVAAALTANPAIIAAVGGFNTFANDVCNAIANFKPSPSAAPGQLKPLPMVYGVPIKVL